MPDDTHPRNEPGEHVVWMLVIGIAYAILTNYYPVCTPWVLGERVCIGDERVRDQRVARAEAEEALEAARERAERCCCHAP